MTNVVALNTENKKRPSSCSNTSRDCSDNVEEFEVITPEALQRIEDAVNAYDAKYRHKSPENQNVECLEAAKQA